MYVDDIKLFAHNEKELKTLITGCEDIQWWYMNGIWPRNMCHANNKNRKTANDTRNITSKSRKQKISEKKETFKYLRILKAGNIKQAEMNEKSKKI